jgi:hypothetical protein
MPTTKMILRKNDRGEMWDIMVLGKNWFTDKKDNPIEIYNEKQDKENKNKYFTWFGLGTTYVNRIKLKELHCTLLLFLNYLQYKLFIFTGMYM